ncbi:MAG: dihydrodipicolinate reductase C-terminal domain-containing protein [Oscillospiraceae bacterium]
MGQGDRGNPPQPEGRRRAAAKLLLQELDSGHGDGRFTAARASAASASRRRSAFRCAAARSQASIPSISARMTLQITHRAASRRIFAAGALRAAQAICGRGPGFYTLDKLLFEI